MGFRVHSSGEPDRGRVFFFSRVELLTVCEILSL
jgi:hypothetical protein